VADFDTSHRLRNCLASQSRISLTRSLIRLCRQNFGNILASSGWRCGWTTMSVRLTTNIEPKSSIMNPLYFDCAGFFLVVKRRIFSNWRSVWNLLKELIAETETERIPLLHVGQPTIQPGRTLNLTRIESWRASNNELRRCLAIRFITKNQFK